MKRFLILLSLIFCNVVFADTINLHWLNADGTTYQNSTCTVDNDLIVPTTPPTKYGYTFTGWKIVNYIPIEYLESTGTQYIDTGVKPKDTLTFITKVQPLTNGFTLFGAMFSETQDMLASFSETAGFVLDYGSGYGYNRISTTWQRGVVYNVAFGNRYIKNLDTGEFFISEDSVNFAKMHLYIYLFGLNNNGTYTPLERSGRFYYFQIYDNDVLVRDFIPVLDANGTPCMYDRVTRQFFYNQGTGNFIAGPVLTE